ncbi:MAG: thioredoxin family protein [Bacilli bacterium]|nr:thioredoxin family protein [Bacilli bacterium]
MKIIYLKYERRDNIEIKVIGSDVKDLKKVKKELAKIAKLEMMNINVQELNDKNNIRKYKVLQTPTLIINDEYKYDLNKIDYNILKRLVMFCSLV